LIAAQLYRAKSAIFCFAGRVLPRKISETIARNEKACRGRRCGRLSKELNSDWEEDAAILPDVPWEEEWAV